MIKILHTGDLHARDKDLPEIKKCLDHLVKTARDEQPDLIVNAGDTFDSQNIKLDSQSAKLIFRVFSELADIAPVAIVLGTPSHDGQAAEVLKYVKAKHQVWISAAPEQIYLIERQDNFDFMTNDPGLSSRPKAVISLIPTPTKQYFQSQTDIETSDRQIADAMGALFAGFGAMAAGYGCPHILVGHFQIGGAYVSETQVLTGVDIELTRDQIGLAGADLVCLGHIHYHQKIRPNIFYCGSIYRKDFGELEEKGFYIHELEYVLPDAEHRLKASRFIETPTQRLVKHDLDFTGSADIATLMMEGAKYAGEVEGANVRMEIKVYQDEAEKLDVGLFEKAFKDSGAAGIDIRLIRIPRQNVRSEKILHLKTLRDKIQERAALNNETVAESILAKADRLETENADQIINAVFVG